MIDGEVAGFDVITHADAYANLHSKLLQSYLIDALLEPKPGPTDLLKATASAQAFLHEVVGSDEKAFESIGYGRDFRYQKPGLAGSALVHDGRLVHAAFFRLPKRESVGNSMASLRQRRRRLTE